MCCLLYFRKVEAKSLKVCQHYHLFWIKVGKMTQLRPSHCEITGRDTVDFIIEAMGDICQRPHWLVLTAIVPTLGMIGIYYAANSPAFILYSQSIWFVCVVYLFKISMFLPCVLSWARIGFFSVLSVPRPDIFEVRGLVRAFDLAALLMAMVAFVASGIDLGIAWASGAGTSIFPARGVVLFAGGMVLVPGLILGGMRLVVSIPAGALGWNLDYPSALYVSSRRNGWLAGLGMAFLCLFPLSMQSVHGLQTLVNERWATSPEIWPWVSFGFVVLLCAVTSHGLGQMLRRLLEGIPEEDDSDLPEAAL